MIQAQYSSTPTLHYSGVFPMHHPSLIPLSHDHHHALALALRCRKQALGQIKPTGVEGLRLRANEFLTLYAAELSSHFEAEEKILFPQMSLPVHESEPLNGE